MELCGLGTLSDILARRNNRVYQGSTSTPPVSPPLPSSPLADCDSLSSSTTSSGFSDPVNASWNASVFLQIVRGLSYVHGRGIIHRDLKPANIFLTGSSLSCPEVKLGDFGLTRFDVFSDTFENLSLAKNDLQRYSQHRRYSTEVGTKTYASPEQVKSLLYTRQTDMFSLGLILYELYRPFGTAMERLEHFNKLRSVPDFVDYEVLENFPSTWNLIKRLTSENPSKRPNCSDLLAELETNEVDRLREVIEQQKREIERLRQTVVVGSPTTSRFTPSS